MSLVSNKEKSELHNDLYLILEKQLIWHGGLTKLSNILDYIKDKISALLILLKKQEFENLMFFGQCKRKEW
jgi:hypothetical protein